jgi:beta-D-galactosyl-(1->4)-L-rhamnose phosphorylase
MAIDLTKGDFTIPGEEGYEELTLRLAEKWGADCIRDSDGTQLPDSITKSGYDIYSTLCLVRADNEWAKKNMDKLQQNYLMSYPVIAEGSTVTIDLLKGFFKEQFILNQADDPKAWWQVFDRTEDKEIPVSDWDVDFSSGTVTVKHAKPYHKYTVNFLVVRIWEEISMYNHITNDWGDKEHLMTIDPRYPETQAHILEYLEKWLMDHPDTTVVRLTSMFYNFTWIWGDDQEHLRDVYSDWGTYAMMATPLAISEFEKKYGYRLTGEDFVNHGLYNSTMNVPSKRYRDWMDFINEFVVEFGKKCVDLIHKYKKKAYMFYDDQWVGTEPYGDRFKEFGFDGIIKCVFNAFEVRLCAGVEGCETHELRMHPYLFPTGLKGEPTFAPGGDPTLDCKGFWLDMRRGLLRAKIDRIGLGGYLHLVEPFPDFCDYIEQVAQEFRLIKSFHQAGKPYVGPCKVAVLTSWGKLRSWICSGHFVHGAELNEMLESLAGMPVDVSFISFDDVVEKGIPSDVKVIINAGRLDSAWSGGDNWKNAELVAKVNEFVAAGGGLIGAGEPSAVGSYSTQFFQLADALGVDRDLGLATMKNKYKYDKASSHFITADNTEEIDFGRDVDNIFVLGKDTTVLADKDGSPTVSVHEFGKGRSVYFSGFKFNYANTRMLLRAIYWAANAENEYAVWSTSNIQTECAYYPANKKLVVINNSGETQETVVQDAAGKEINITLKPFDIEIVDA